MNNGHLMCIRGRGGVGNLADNCLEIPRVALHPLDQQRAKVDLSLKKKIQIKKF